MPSQRRAALAVMSLVTLVWAGNFTAGKLATGGPLAPRLHPFIISSLRIWLAAAFFAALMPREHRRALLSARHLRQVLPLALTGIATNQILFASGLRLTLPSHSAIIHALIPVFVVGFAWLAVRERPAPLALLGMALAIAGALFVALSAPADHRRHTLLGDLLTTAGTLAFSAYVVLGRRIIPAIGAWRAVTGGFVASVPFTIPFFVWGCLEQSWATVDGPALAGLGYMVVGATFFCYSAHMWSLTHLDPLSVSIFVDLQPMLGTAIAALFALEPLTPTLLIGGVVAVCGVALVQIAPRPAVATIRT